MRHRGPEVFGVSVPPHGVIEILLQVRGLKDEMIRIWGTSWGRYIQNTTSCLFFVSPRVLDLGPDFVVVGGARVVGVGEDEGAVEVPQVVGRDVFPDPIGRHELSQLGLQILNEFHVSGGLLN